MPRTTAALHSHSQGRSGGSEGRLRRSVGLRNRDIIRSAAMVLAVWLAVKLFWLTNALFFAVFLGMLFGIAVSAGVDRLQKYRVPRGIGAALIVLTFLGALVGFGAWVAPTLRAQGAELRGKLPEAADRAQQWVKQHQGGVLGLLISGNNAAQASTPAPAGPAKSPQVANPSNLTADPTSVDSMPASAKTAPSIPNQLRERMSGATRYLFPFVKSTVEALGGILLIIFLSIYFAAEPDLYRRGILALLPAKKRARGTLMMDRIATVLRKWLLTQLIAMVVMGTLSTVILLLLGVKAAFALGVLVGLLEFIPTVGPIISAVPAVAMGFLDSPQKAMYVAIAYWALQFVENHLLIPLLMKEGLKLPPALTVVAQALLAIVFGFIGLMVAVPLLACVIVVFQMMYIEKLPVEGTWTYPVFNSDLDEQLEGSYSGRP